MADLVRYELEDGSTVHFRIRRKQAALHYGSGEPEIIDAGRRGTGLQHIARTATEVADSIRSAVPADGMHLPFGVKVTGEAGLWFFSKVSGEDSIWVTLIWKKPPSP
jgi:hypothetical protein